MRWSTFVLPMVGLAAVLFAGTALAAEPHSWCVTGAPMTQGGGDSVTNAVLSNVCNNNMFASCCTPGGRWGLSCVQAGAAYARDNNLGGADFCGRYQWAQGLTSSNEQAYPRDYNLFATNGSVSGLRDSDGPIAASGSVNIASFHLNLKLKDSVALAAQGSIYLSSGTVNGSVIYGTSYTDSNVTFFNASRPTAKTAPFPINFPWVTSNLILMSQAIQRYDAIPATKSNTNVVFAGSDPELNVFSIPAASLTGTTSYTFNVPAGSNVIVNVSGAAPNISNAGITGTINASKLLWNFPDATTLRLSGVGFIGSILAPKATGNFSNGSLAGTAVVAAASPGNVELYSAPYQVPSCTGALCLDPTWSVSADTPVDDQRKAAIIREEAGFLEIPSESYTAEGQARTSPKHRVWYSFQPARTEPKSKPVVIFFNGGPGTATTSILFAFNTGQWTLDPQITGANRRVVANALASNWTQFANILYVDQPATGFSYPLANDDGTKPDIGTDQDRDAGMFLSVLVRFLQRHPALENNRVVIAGESYGGVRATKMLHHVYNYASLTNPSAAYQDSQLDADLRNYFIDVLGTALPSATQLATKFGHQVLIEPVVVGNVQGGASDGTADAFDLSQCKNPTCMTTSPDQPTSCDAYNCDQDYNYSGKLETTASTNLTDVTTLSTALGVDAKTIEWMKASSRTKAYGRNDGAIIPPINMTAVFGTLNAEDNYLLSSNSLVLEEYKGASRWSTSGQGLLSGTDFVNHLHNNVSTFITVSKFDTVVYSPDIPYGLFRLLSTPSFASIVSAIGFSKTQPTGLVRPGMMSVFYQPATDTRNVVMPFQYAAGHSISMRKPADLLTDVMAWYASTPH